MSYSSRRHIIHHDKYGTVHRLEVQQKDYASSSVEMLGANGVFDFEHDEFLSDSDSILKVYENVVQKGTLDVYPLIENSTDFALLQDIFESDEDEFRLVWKIDGTTFFTGSVINDLLEYPERAYKFPATISAKDFSRLEGKDYPLTSGRVSIIKAIAELLGYLGYDLNIESATSWTEDDITEGTDFLQQIYIDRYALRTYARTGDESDETITVFEALEHVLNDNCLILKQLNGVFKVDQISAYSDPENVLVTVYDSDGDEVSSSTIDTTLDASSEGIIVKGNSSKTKGYPAIRQARVKFDHRTSVSGIKFPSVVRLESGSSAYSQVFISDGDQSFRLTGRIEADETLANPDMKQAEFQIEFEVGGYWWDGGGWVGSQTLLDFDSVIEVLGPPTQTYVTYADISTTNVPSDADGAINITLYHGTVVDGTIDETRYRNFGFVINNPVAQENSTYIDFRLTQEGGFSSGYEHKATLFGDGPIGYARSALTRSDDSIIIGTWGRRGDVTLDKDFHENVLKEIVDVQRTFIDKLSAALYGIYNPTKILVYRSKNFFYTGGRFNGKEGDWAISLMRVNIQTSTSDTFEDLPKFTSDESTGSAPAGSGGGGGIDPGTGDARWFKRINLLSEVDPEDISTLLDNINLGTTDDVQFANITAKSIDIDGSEFVDSSRNLSAAEGDFSGVINQEHRPGTLGGNIRLRTNDTSGSWGIGYSSTGEDERLFVRNFHESGNPIVATFSGVNFGIGEVTPDEQLHVDDFIRADSGYKAGSTTVIDSDTDSFFRNGEYSGTLDVEGEATFFDDIYLEKGQNWDDTDSFLTTNTYAGGFGGTGTQLRHEDDMWHMVVDRLTVRDIARFYELEIQRFRSVGGSIMVNEGMAVVSAEQVGDASWSWSDDVQIFENPQPIPYTFMNQYRCFTEEDLSMEFQEGDLVKRQQWTGRGIGVTRGTVGDIETGDIDPEVNTPARYFDIALEPGDDTPAEDMDFVRMGSINDPDRMGGIQLTSSDDGAPYKRTYYGLDNWSKENSIDIIRSQDGRLDNLTIPEFSELDGTQENMFGILTDNFFAWKNVFISVAGGEMKFGENADGNGNAGIYQDENNYWLPGVGFSVLGAVSADNVISAINASTEGIDISGSKIQLNGDTSVDGDFEMTGKITSATTFASDVDIRGVLNAVSGTFGDVEIAPGGELSGIGWHINETDWVHPTLGGYVYAEPNIASTSDNAGTGTWGIWTETVTQSTTGSPETDESDHDKFEIPYRHKEGINTLRLSGRRRRVISSTGGISTTHLAQMTFSVDGESDTDNIPSGWNDFTMELDVSGLTDGTSYDIVINLFAEAGVEGTSDPGSATTTTELEKSITIQELTT